MKQILSLLPLIQSFNIQFFSYGVQFQQNSFKLKLVILFLKCQFEDKSLCVVKCVMMIISNTKNSAFLFQFLNININPQRLVPLKRDGTDEREDKKPVLFYTFTQCSLSNDCHTWRRPKCRKFKEAPQRKCINFKALSPPFTEADHHDSSS